MTKKRQKSICDYLILTIAIILGALTLVIMIAPGIVVDLGLGTVAYSVYELLNYGDTLRVGLLLALIFVILATLSAIILVAIKLLGKKSKAEKLFAFCASILALVAGVLFFFARQLTGTANSSLISLGVGSILAGIFAILLAVSLCCYLIKKAK